MTAKQKLEVENRQMRAALEKIAEVTSYERVNDLRGECMSKGNNYRLAYVNTIVNVRVIAEDTLIMAKAMDAFGEREEGPYGKTSNINSKASGAQ